jgi:hypothetical protein
MAGVGLSFARARLMEQLDVDEDDGFFDLNAYRYSGNNPISCKRQITTTFSVPVL